MEALPAQLLLLLLLQLSDSKLLYNEFQRVGFRTILPCAHIPPEQLQRCEGTTWTFMDLRKSHVEVVTKGQVSTSAPPLRDRLRVHSDCSLEVRNVGPDVAGRYFCRHDDIIRGGPPVVPNSEVTLSVVSVSEEHTSSSSSLLCSVLSPLPFESLSVTWLYRDRAVDPDDPVFKPSALQNGSKITVPSAQYLDRDNEKNTFQCMVSSGAGGNVFRLGSIESARICRISATSKRTQEILKGMQKDCKEETLVAPGPASRREDGDGAADGLFVRNIVLVVLGSAALLILTVLLTWTIRRGLRAQRNRSHVASVVFENIREPSAVVTIRAPPAAAEGSD